jgi:DNA-binding LytR/AlgR family response regulator
MHITRMTMKRVLSKLSQREFIRVHRSFILPLQNIQGVRGKTIQLKGGVEIPVGSSYEESFFKMFGNGK